MIDKVAEVEWDIRLETLIEDCSYRLAPICTVVLIFEDNTEKEFQIQIGDKTILVDSGPHDLPIALVNKIIDRIEEPLRKQVDNLMVEVERITKYGSFEKEFWDKFWVDNAMGK